MAVYGPTGVAVDAAGNTYVAGNSSGQVYKVDPEGNSVTLPFRWLKRPFGVTVDAAGNVYTCDYQYDLKYKRGFVHRLSARGVQTVIEVPELRNPTDVHVDSVGNLYVVDFYHGRIVRVAPNGTQETIPPAPLGYPFGIVVDDAGTITVSNGDETIGIVRRDAAGNQTTLPFTSLDRPSGLDIDAAGNVYVAQVGVQSDVSPRVLKMTPEGVQSVLPFAPGVLRRPMGIAVTSSEILVADEYGIERLAL
ncbi:hypothetical protein [Nocardia sp. CS682]|uniref:hypothetical protein n=1 Tax=Nocardia sp. CS682 TaxID=1047172 RepID=UPI00107506D8|nr:hypothetical protein [Nocardia sp. CS682]QBS41982.1 hypothetical protein DMB37_19425 [Nocardia sp. CS682]